MALESGQKAEALRKRESADILSFRRKGYDPRCRAPQSRDRWSIKNREPEQSASSCPRRLVMKRMGSLFQRHQIRDPESSSGADDRSDIARILEGDEERAALKGRTRIPCRKRRHPNDQNRVIGSKSVKLSEKLCRERIPLKVPCRNAFRYLELFGDDDPFTVLWELRQDFPHLLGPGKKSQAMFLDALPLQDLQEGLEILIVPAIDLLRLHNLPISCSRREAGTLVLAS